MVVERVNQGIEGDPPSAVARPAIEHQEAAFAGPACHLRK
jgi:hypothetical protein